MDNLKLTSASVRLTIFFLTAIIVAHIAGCIWFFAAKIKHFSIDTWVY
jgi:hypothetical protein